MSLFDRLICPLDQLPLEQKERSLVCANNHTFDLAKSGYVNLLPVQSKNSKDPGDSKEMVTARQRFLNSQAYEPIADAIAELIKVISLSESSFSAPLSLLDAGCGEGYYLSSLQKLYSSQLIQCIGLDISKWAVMAASKRNKELGWIVGSNASLPMPAQRFDGVLCLFGFPIFKEFSRVLTDSGLLLLVESGPDHLIELRQILYPSIHDYKQTHSDGVTDFELVSEEAKTFGFTLNSQTEIQNLLSMTPHIHKASYDGKEAVKQLESIRLTADIKLRWYRNKGNE